MEKEKYKALDFLLNESFQSYVLQKNDDDTQYWTEWIKANPEALEAIETAREIITFTHYRKSIKKHPEASKQVFDAIQTKIKTENQIRRINLRNTRVRIIWYAASIMLLIGLSTGLYVFNKKEVIRDDSFLEVIVPKGQRSQLLLPDNTRVWLNAGTIFRYPQFFSKNNRSVYLEGEAFFAVQPNKKSPFYVGLKDNLSIKVTGTEFNVKCYPGEKTIETTLVKGSINIIKEDHRKRIIKEYTLQPNDQALYCKNDETMVITKLEPDRGENTPAQLSSSYERSVISDKIASIIAWKEEELVFNDEPFYEIAVKMERWFGIKITLKDELLKQERFTGKFTNKETVYQILDIINRTEPINYKVLDHEIVIYSKRKKIANY
jgi:ferric-dicitrate binding protein FerR (iron transport regulator)